MPGPSKRTAKGDGPSDRRARAQRARRTGPAAKPRRLARRVSWSRRIGVAAALLLVVGGSIAFASQALDSPSGRPTPGAPPPPPPTLLAPARLTRAAELDLVLSRPAALRSDQAYRVRLYVNDELVRERSLPESDRFRLGKIPLQRGENEIRAAIVGSGGESQLSAAVLVTRDDLSPSIRVISPREGERVHAAVYRMIGSTEPGADMTVTDARTGEQFETSVGTDGRFESTLQLTFGQNPLVLRSRDAVGNVGRTRIVLVRDVSRATLTLAVSPADVDSTTLPVRLEVVATVRDEHGQPIDGVPVTFGLSPPNLPTTTHRAVTEGGVASWSDIDLPASGDVLGTWLATALATLPSGVELRDDESVSVH